MPDAGTWRPRVSRIDNPIADDQWEYVTPKGEQRRSRLTVGHPVHLPEERLWYCPVRIQGYTRGIDTVFGLGPVDALMNAMTLVRRFFEENSEVVPAMKPAGARRRTARGKALEPSARKSPRKR